MFSAATSILIEVFIPVASFVLEIGLLILLASIRPWRYLLSPPYRASVNAEHIDNHPIAKWWHLLWGSVLLLASIAVVFGLMMALIRLEAQGKPESPLRGAVTQFRSATR